MKYNAGKYDVAVIGAGREDKEAPTKEEWKQED